MTLIRLRAPPCEKTNAEFFARLAFGPTKKIPILTSLTYFFHPKIHQMNLFPLFKVSFCNHPKTSPPSSLVSFHFTDFVMHWLNSPECCIWHFWPIFDYFSHSSCDKTENLCNEETWPSRQSSQQHSKPLLDLEATAGFQIGRNSFTLLIDENRWVFI